MCISHAKFALFTGGGIFFPNTSHLASSLSILPLQSASLKGGFARTKSAFKSLCRSFKKLPSLFHFTLLLSIVLMARFILHNLQVVWLLSCPYIAMRSDGFKASPFPF